MSPSRTCSPSSSTRCSDTAAALAGSEPSSGSWPVAERHLAHRAYWAALGLRGGRDGMHAPTQDPIVRLWRAAAVALSGRGSGAEAAELVRLWSRCPQILRTTETREMKLILYFADGFAWQYTGQRSFMPGFWDQRRPLRTLLGYSSTVMPAIVSGPATSRDRHLDGVLPRSAASAPRRSASSRGREPRCCGR